MSTNFVKYLVCLTSTAAIVRAQLFEVTVPSQSKPVCTGSLVLTSPPRFGSPEHRILTEDSSLGHTKNFTKKITITKVEVHGCGCFQVYNKKKGRGKTFILRSNETIKKGDKTFFRHARSMKRVMCTNNH